MGSGFSRTYRFCEPEVEQFDSGLGQQDVVGLEIAMDDSFTVRSIERVADLGGVFERLLDG